MTSEGLRADKHNTLSSIRSSSPTNGNYNIFIQPLAGMTMILHEGKVVLQDITRKREEMNCVDKTIWWETPISSRQWSSRTDQSDCTA